MYSNVETILFGNDEFVHICNCIHELSSALEITCIM